MTKLTLSYWNIFGCHPPVGNHGGMVVDMEEGHLVVLFAQDEEYLQSNKSAMKSVQQQFLN